MKPIRRLVRISGICAIAALAGAAIAGPASASGADEFLRQFEGSWRGGGSVKRSLDAKPMRIQCALNMSLNEAKKQLENTGKCATTSGKGNVEGEIVYSDSGHSLRGTFLRSYGNTKVLKSSGSWDSDAMTFNATHQDTITEEVSRSRTIISKPSGNRFVSSIYEYDRSRGAFIRIGELVFKR